MQKEIAELEIKKKQMVWFISDYLFSLLFTIEKCFSKSYLHVTAQIDNLHLLKTIKWVKSTQYVTAQKNNKLKIIK